jgi:hypothetical protein
MELIIVGTALLTLPVTETGRDEYVDFETKEKVLELDPVVAAADVAVIVPLLASEDENPGVDDDVAMVDVEWVEAVALASIVLDRGVSPKDCEVKVNVFDVLVRKRDSLATSALPDARLPDVTELLPDVPEELTKTSELDANAEEVSGRVRELAKVTEVDARVVPTAVVDGTIGPKNVDDS